MATIAARGANGKLNKQSATDDPASDTGFAVDPAIIDASLDGERSEHGGVSGTDNAPKRKRGRPAGGRNSSTTQKAHVGKRGSKSSPLLSESLLSSIHLMLATITKSPELALSPDESRNLAEAANAVAEHYDLETSAKTLAWGNLIICAGGLYMPRMLMIAARRGGSKKESAPSNAPTPAPSDNIASILLGVGAE